MDYTKKIAVSDIISPKHPYVATANDVKSWFKTEFLELTFGESNGRPSASFVMRKEYLTRFLENGWTVDAVISSVEGGEWKAVSSSKSHESSDGGTKNEGKTTAKRTSSNSSESESSSNSEKKTNNLTDSTSRQKSDSISGSDSLSTSNSSSSETSEGGSKSSSSNSKSSSLSTQTIDSLTNTTSSTDSSSDDVTTSNTNGSEKSSTSSSDATSEDSRQYTTHNGNSENTTESVAAYWAAYNRIRLRRNRMVPELVLQSMLDSFTDAYNQGRGIDNERYDELVSLYAVTISTTEREMDDLVAKGVSLDRLYDHVYWSFYGSIKSAEESAKATGADSLAAALDEIRRRFDAMIAKARSELISAGLYNGTVWITTEAGIERQRSAAILSAKADANKSGVEANVAVIGAKNSAYAVLADIRKTMADLADKRRTTATEMRNTVVKWLADVVASRKEDAPQIEEFAQLVQTFGFSVGASGNVL